MKGMRIVLQPLMIFFYLCILCFTLYVFVRTSEDLSNMLPLGRLRTTSFISWADFTKIVIHLKYLWMSVPAVMATTLIFLRFRHAAIAFVLFIVSFILITLGSHPESPAMLEILPFGGFVILAWIGGVVCKSIKKWLGVGVIVFLLLLLLTYMWSAVFLRIQAGMTATPEYCSQLPNYGQKQDLCYRDLSKKYGDISYCKYIPNNLNLYSCLHTTNFKNVNRGVCTQFTLPGTAETCNEYFRWHDEMLTRCTEVFTIGEDANCEEFRH